MNFLAHLYLSGDFDQLMIGNFMADFVKGKPAATLAPQLVKGIVLHRAIDFYTDTHPIVKQSKKRLQPSYGKYSGVIVDIFYDHFLASLWSDYSSQPLPQFASDTYHLMNSNIESLPLSMHQMLFFMQKNNWLVSYGSLWGVERALTGIANRTTFHSKMELAVFDLQSDYQSYKSEFLEFFPEVVRFVKNWKVENV